MGKPQKRRTSVGAAGDARSRIGLPQPTAQRFARKGPVPNPAAFRPPGRLGRARRVALAATDLAKHVAAAVEAGRSQRTPFADYVHVVGQVPGGPKSIASGA
jgi:hypothetical protein